MKKITILAMLIAVGILMQLIESFFPIVMIIPGYKIGLANIAGLFALYAFGIQEMVIVTFLRIFLASLATGTLFSIPFILSISGCTLSCLAMALAKKSGWFTIYGVSVAGAASHTLGQVLAI
ncbi:MAG: Gx transporter family protein, partial [Allobaculum sp.]|nr:Gx transporter family protein [Allobaculum sp.]